MPYGLPQSAMYQMRGQYADGNAVRNRPMEQFATRSGNPQMPLFNTPHQQPVQASMPVQAQGPAPPMSQQARLMQMLQQLHAGQQLPQQPIAAPKPFMAQPPTNRAPPQQAVMPAFGYAPYG